MDYKLALIVEDEAAIAELLSLHLRHAGFVVDWAADGEQAQQMLQRNMPDLIVLDWMLPGSSGPELLRAWRTDKKFSHIPVLMLTARSDEAEIITGLKAGADDYMCKPFSTRELIARVEALMRRSAQHHARDEKDSASSQVLEYHGLKLDADAYTIRFHGHPLRLASTEFRLLQYLMQNKGRALSRSQLLDKVWGESVYIEERTVDVHIKRMRESMGTAGSLIETVRSVGYKFAA